MNVSSIYTHAYVLCDYILYIHACMHTCIHARRTCSLTIHSPLTCPLPLHISELDTRTYTYTHTHIPEEHVLSQFIRP